MTADDDEDFDCIAELVDDIFKSLPRLHTLDINAWINDIDGSFGDIPEKALFSRREPRGQGLYDNNKKTIWTARLESLYQENHASITNIITKVKGNFEGRDADGPWLGGEMVWVSTHSRHWKDGEYLLGPDIELDEMFDSDE